MTTDTICAGVHFLAGDPLDTVARKAVRVNVSDLAAKGCRPVAMTLSCAWHAGAGEADHAAFARGLGTDLDAYGIDLLGGDTTRLPEGQGPVFTVTMLGVPLGPVPDRVPSRAGARPGDALWVTGMIGDGWLGLQHLTGGRDAGPHAEAVIRAYRLPEPPAGLARVIAVHARASLDVSDGLVADAGHLARASGVAVTIEAGAVPLSGAGRAFTTRGGDPAALLTGGDDYQALLAAAPEAEDALIAAGLTRIGRCDAGAPGVRVLDGRGRDVTPARGGYAHF